MIIDNCDRNSVADPPNCSCPAACLKIREREPVAGEPAVLSNKRLHKTGGVSMSKKDLALIEAVAILSQDQKYRN